MTDVLIALAASVGSAAAAGVGAFRYAQSRAQTGHGLGGGGPAGAGERGAPVFVRLSTEDSDRIERIDSLLARLIALEEQTQAAVSRLADLVVQARLEAAARQGELTGWLRAGGRG
jgi:uncharacterized spore protein YtfJ